MKIAGVSRQTVFNHRDKLVKEGLEELLKRDWAGARTPTVHGQLAEKFIDELKAGTFRQARDAQKWIEKRTAKKLTEGGVRKLIHRLGGKLKMPRKSHRKKDHAASGALRAELPERLTKVVGENPDKPVRLWVLDEHRYGLLPVIRRTGRFGEYVSTRLMPPPTSGTCTRRSKLTARTTRSCSSRRPSTRTSTWSSSNRLPTAAVRN